MTETRYFTASLLGLPTGQVPQMSDLLAGLAGQSLPHVPLIAPAMLLGQPAMGAVVELMQPPKDLAVIHESQVFSRDQDYVAEGPCDVHTSLQPGDNALRADFSLTQAGCAIGTMQTRLRFVPPEVLRGLKGTTFGGHLDNGDMIWRQSDIFRPEVIHHYVALAGDQNPIHVSDEYARQSGLPKAVVPGMCLIGLCENMVAAAFEQAHIQQLKARFMAFVPVGDVLSYGVMVRARNRDGQPTLARVFVVRPDRVIAAIADLSFGNMPQA